ncbi:MAG: anthranilate synthase component II [Salibacteraceae bacterium]
MKLLVLDNYDSFTYNLVYQLRELGLQPDVVRNDQLAPEAITTYDAAVLSPGPGLPSEAGNMPAIIAAGAGKVPMLGICLGHQAIAEYLGGRLHNRKQVLHGIQHDVLLEPRDSPLFQQMATRFPVGRYHSWELSSENLPAAITVTARDESGAILAIENRSLQLFGVQFHPESILTPNGPRLLENFVQRCQIPVL